MKTHATWYDETLTLFRDVLGQKTIKTKCARRVSVHLASDDPTKVTCDLCVAIGLAEAEANARARES